MKTIQILIAAVAVLLPPSAFAGVGQTLAQVNAKYGKAEDIGRPESWWSGLADSRVVYRVEGLEVVVFLNNGVVVSECWNFVTPPSAVKIGKLLSKQTDLPWQLHGEIYITKHAGGGDDALPKGALVAMMFEDPKGDHKRWAPGGSLVIAIAESFQEAWKAFQQEGKTK